MSLNNINTLRKDRGFTIVELLIVIVIIGILATITIVVFNGAINRANSASAQATAASLQKKIEAYNAAYGSYPTDTSNTNYTATLNTKTESQIQGANVNLGTPSATNGKNTVEVSLCSTSGATGYRIRYWDFSANALSGTTITGNLNSTACAAWTALT